MTANKMNGTQVSKVSYLKLQYGLKMVAGKGRNIPARQLIALASNGFAPWGVTLF